jgi:hypothetical protein
MLLKTKHPRTIFRLAMASLALFGVLGMVHLPGSFGEGMVDGIRGALLGVSVALLYLAFRRGATDGRSSSP